MQNKSSELTKEQIMKAIHCETAEELIAYAKSEGIDLTKDEAEAYIDELSDYELKDGELKNIAGGSMQGPTVHSNTSICYMVSLCRKDM